MKNVTELLWLDSVAIADRGVLASWHWVFSFQGSSNFGVLSVTFGICLKCSVCMQEYCLLLPWYYASVKIGVEEKYFLIHLKNLKELFPHSS